MPKKLSLGQISNVLSTFPYTMMGGDLENTRSVLAFKCDTHGVFHTTIKKIRKGVKCQKCSARERALRSASDLQTLVSQLTCRFGDKILYSEGYKTRKEKCSFVCAEHGFFISSFDVLLRKGATGGCGRCAASLRGRRLARIGDIRELAISKGLVLVSDSYLAHSQKLELRCEKHSYTFSRTLSSLRKRRGCVYCSYERSGRDRRLPEDTVRAMAVKNNVRLVGKYENALSKTTFLCPKHGEFESTLNAIRNGHRNCGCSVRQSGPQNELANFVRLLGLETVSNDRSTLSSPDTGRQIEIDILIPTKNLAIEYCGLYWHNEDSPYPRGKYSHKLKHDLCAQKGIQLITIFEDEWLGRKKQVETILKAKLGLLPKLYARKTKLVTLDRSKATRFLEDNHLQGSCQFILALGLEYHGEVVACAMLSKHHRSNRPEAVLSRICFSDRAIIGGSSKLLTRIVKEARDLGFSSLISWSDNRWSDGGVYRALGMASQELPPDYSYAEKGKSRRISKQSCQKRHLMKRGAQGQTELEMAKSLGYSRIWDCGKIRWSMDL